MSEVDLLLDALLAADNVPAAMKTDATIMSQLLRADKAPIDDTQRCLTELEQLVKNEQQPLVWFVFSKELS